MKCVLLLVSSALMCVHCGLPDMTLLYEGRDIRTELFSFLYHDELFSTIYNDLKSLDSDGHLLCVATPPIEPEWYYPTGEIVPTGNNARTSTHYFRQSKVPFKSTGQNVARLSRFRDGGSGNSNVARNNGLWQCRFKLNSALLSNRFIQGLYSRHGFGRITYIRCGTPTFTGTHRESTLGHLPCITRGGPPSSRVWIYNGKEVVRNNMSSREGIEASISLPDFSNKENLQSSRFDSMLRLSGYFPGVFEYSVSNKAMSDYISHKIYIQGEPPTNLEVLLIGSEKVEVSWTPPTIPPGNGYRITVDNNDSSAVTTSQSKYSPLNIRPGVHSIQVKSLSSHYPGETVQVDRVYVAGLYADTSSTSVTISWPYLKNMKIDHAVRLSRVMGPDQELCPDFEDDRILITTKLSVLFRKLEEFSDYTVIVSSELIPPISLTFKTLSGVPSSAPKNLRHTVTSRTASMRWEPIDCLALNGNYLGYEVNFAQVNEPITNTWKVMKEVFIIEDLQPAIEYTFSVAVINTEGTGPFSERLLILFEEVPGVVSNFSAELTESGEIVIKWNPPLEPNGVLTAYEVAYILNGQRLPTTINITNVNARAYTISKLNDENIVLDVSVRAYTNAGPGERAILSRNFTVADNFEQVIVPDVRVTHIPGTTSVRVEWDRINAMGLANYVVYYGSDIGNEQSITVPSSENSIVITDLNDDKEYRVRVVGVGTMNTLNYFSGSHAADSLIYIPCQDCGSDVLVFTVGLATVAAIFFGMIFTAIILVRLWYNCRNSSSEESYSEESYTDSMNAYGTHEKTWIENDTSEEALSKNDTSEEASSKEIHDQD